MQQSYDAASMGLPAGWYSALFAVAAGKLTSSQLPMASLNDNMRFQLRCIEGMMAFTSGDWQSAEGIISDALRMPYDLPIEFTLAQADLERCHVRRERSGRR
jgi:hypothetical protein